MRQRFGTVAALVLVAAAPAAAQNPPSPAPAGTPAACVQAANQWRTRQVTQLRAENKPIDAAALLAEARRQAAECGAKFTVEGTPSAQLTDLATFYKYVGDGAQAEAALARALAATDLTPRQHADAVLLALSNALAEGDPFAGINSAAEALITQLDALPDSLLDKRIRAHQLALGRYGYGDVDAGVQKHAQVLVELGRKAGPQGRSVMVSAFADLARAAGDYLMPDSALRIVSAAARELGQPIEAMPQLADAFERYSLAGKPGAPLAGDLWLNPDGPAGEVPMGGGKVRLIQWTAHWCAPCRNSYPGMIRLAQRFAGQPFEVLFTTGVYGSFEGKPATEEQELAADRVYYPEHGIPFRIAVNHNRKNPGGQGQQPPLVDQQYAVGGIPQIVVVDQRGIIRQIVVGWDQGNEQRLGAYIESLLKGEVQ